MRPENENGPVIDEPSSSYALRLGFGTGFRAPASGWAWPFSKPGFGRTPMVALLGLPFGMSISFAVYGAADLLHFEQASAIPTDVEHRRNFERLSKAL